MISIYNVRNLRNIISLPLAILFAAIGTFIAFRFLPDGNDEMILQHMNLNNAISIATAIAMFVSAVIFAYHGLLYRLRWNSNNNSITELLAWGKKGRTVLLSDVRGVRKVLVENKIGPAQVRASEYIIDISGLDSPFPLFDMEDSFYNSLREYQPDWAVVIPPQLSTPLTKNIVSKCIFWSLFSIFVATVIWVVYFPNSFASLLDGLLRYFIPS